MEIAASPSVSYPPTGSKWSENRFFIFSVFHKKSHGLYQGFWI